MPGINGLQLCRKTRESRYSPDIKVIVSTAGMATQEEAKKAGCDEYFLKTDPLPKLRDKVRQYASARTVPPGVYPPEYEPYSTAARSARASGLYRRGAFLARASVSGSLGGGHWPAAPVAARRRGPSPGRPGECPRGRPAPPPRPAAGGPPGGPPGVSH